MDWLEPWTSTEDAEKNLVRGFAQQLANETSYGHELHGMSVKLIGRGDGDDALFEILDSSGRVASVHLVWQGRQQPPWPASRIYASLVDWRVAQMIPEHDAWIADRK